MTQAAIRETREETGVDCEITGLVGIYTDPKHVILYTSDGEARQEFSIVFTARAIGGTPTPSSESTEVHWIDAAQVTESPDGPVHADADRTLPELSRPPVPGLTLRPYLHVTPVYPPLTTSTTSTRQAINGLRAAGYSRTTSASPAKWRRNAWSMRLRANAP